MSLGYYEELVDISDNISINVIDVLNTCDVEDIEEYLMVRGYNNSKYDERILQYLKDEWLRGVGSYFDWKELLRFIEK